MHEIRNAPVSRPFCVFRYGCCFSDDEPNECRQSPLWTQSLAYLSRKSDEPLLQFFYGEY